MSAPDTPRSPSLGITLLRNLFLLFLFVVAASLGLAILYERYRPPVLSLTILADAGLGLVAGFTARFVLSKQTGLLRAIAATTALITGLVLLGLFTGWQVGIGPLHLRSAAADWVGLAQVAAGTVSAFLALRAWHGPASRVATSSTTPTSAPAARPARRGQARPRRTVATRIQATQPGAAREKPAKPKRRRIQRRKPQVQLSLAEEHRCPYCLELVKPGDPRGVVACDVCHTLHHADCWAITGACQVPHYNS